MKLKILLIPIMLISILLLVHFLHFKNGPSKAMESQDKSFSASIVESGFADSDKGFRGYSTLRFHSDGISAMKLDFLWLPYRPTKEIYFLDYQSTQREVYSRLSGELRKKLQDKGFTVRSASAHEASSLNDAILIVPTGIFPSELATNGYMSKFISRNNTLIYIGLPSETFLEEDGTQTQLQAPDITFDQGSIKPAFNASVLDTNTLKINGYAVFITNVTGYSDEVAGELSDFITYNSWEKPEGGTSINLSGQEFTRTVFTSNGKSDYGYFRLIINGRNRTEVLDVQDPKKFNSRLTGSTESLGNESENFVLFLNASQTNSNLLINLLVSKDGTSRDKVTLDSIALRDVWLSSYSYQNNLEPGDYLLTITDQNQKEYAKAYLHIQNLSVSLANVKEFHYNFRAFLDGLPIQETKAAVSVDNSSTRREIMVENGAFTVPADLADGRHVFNISVMGKSMQVQYDKTGYSIATFYLIYGPIAIFISAAAYFLLKRPSVSKYLLSIPDAEPGKEKIIGITEGEFLAMLAEISEKLDLRGQPLTFNEIKLGFRCFKANTGTILDSNLMDVLAQMRSKGLIKSNKDYFIPSAQVNKGLGYLIARRIVTEGLVSKGISYTPSENAIHATVDTKPVCINIYDRESNPVPRIEKNCRNMIVFLNREALDEFMQMLKNANGQFIGLILELEYGTVRLSLADDFGKAVIT